MTVEECSEVSSSGLQQLFLEHLSRTFHVAVQNKVQLIRAVPCLHLRGNGVGGR